MPVLGGAATAGKAGVAAIFAFPLQVGAIQALARGKPALMWPA